METSSLEAPLIASNSGNPSPGREIFDAGAQTGYTLTVRCRDANRDFFQSF